MAYLLKVIDQALLLKHDDTPWCSITEELVIELLKTIIRTRDGYGNIDLKKPSVCWLNPKFVAEAAKQLLYNEEGEPTFVSSDDKEYHEGIQSPDVVIGRHVEAVSRIVKTIVDYNAQVINNLGNYTIDELVFTHKTPHYLIFKLKGRLYGHAAL